ncbi:PTS mannitol transporter subunit IICB [Pectinatus haikarae]|uniref:PTS system mannitol-specific EIICB component n=1 Tax=Pectinatus haikarae TaxID=349096 RepID=A0ABT9Y7S6_9FIRM|nr:PTS mannitol transporter subunit IICB [Pectinatus haikarae]MDQ0203886.1 PTS system mannitol-specific IIC component [Pectinatus haikarae]
MTINVRAKIQAFGGFLTAMVIPNMGAFIAWGFITALFIPTGWIPNEAFAKLVSPMVSLLLPLLLSYAGGKLVYDTRGGIAGTIGTIGLIVGSDIPMFLGAMIMGPLSAFIIKKFDKSIENRIPSGFEMLINNFSLGIIGFILCLLANALIGPVIQDANYLISTVVKALVSTGILPVLALINEPTKVLFLNNVIDQGIYYPLGMQDALATGKSIYFMAASNPGAGLGLLLAYSIFGRGNAKSTAPGAIIIHFFGGIHEMYFPFVLMKPLTIIAMIAGSACGIFTFQMFDAGLVAGPSPGSIFAYLALTPKGHFIGIIAGVLVAALVSFIITSFILKISKDNNDDELSASILQTQSMKNEGKDILSNITETGAAQSSHAVDAPIKFVAFACDAGMDSSAMGASVMKKKLLKNDIDIRVEHFAIEKVPSEADVVITHKNLAERAKLALKDKKIVAIENYLADPKISELIEKIKEQQK